MERSMDDVVETVKNAKERGKKCTLLIGAGCSVTAGIPTAKGFVEIIEKDYTRAFKRARTKTYANCMAELSLGERRDLIADYVDKAKVNWAHIAIAQLMKANPTFAIRGEKRLFLGMHRPSTLDFKGGGYSKWAVVPTYPIDAFRKN